MADDQQPPAQRYWFPYWTAPPQPPPPPAPAPRPAVRPQLSRRESGPAPQPSPPPATPSPSRRQPHPQPASRGAGGAPAPPAQPQPTRLPSRPSPAPARVPPLSPIREPNARAPPESVPIAKEGKPPSPLHPVAQDVPKQKDMIVPQEKTIHERPVDSKTQSKAVEKEKEEEKKKDKEEEKEKKKDKEEHKDKKKDKEKEHKEKEKDKEKEHKEKEKGKDKEKEHGSKLHKELKAGVADMVHKLSSSAPSSGGHERAASAAAGTTIITLAGENKGASMKVDSSAVADVKPADAAGSKERRGQKLDGGVVVGGKETAPVGGKGLTAFVNSNVQVINNSLLLQSSCNGGDPGVHLKLSTKSKKKDGEEAGGKSGSAAAPKK